LANHGNFVISTLNYIYLFQGGYVFTVICLLVC